MNRGLRSSGTPDLKAHEMPTKQLVTPTKFTELKLHELNTVVDWCSIE